MVYFSTTHAHFGIEMYKCFCHAISPHMLLLYSFYATKSHSGGPITQPSDLSAFLCLHPGLLYVGNLEPFHQPFDFSWMLPDEHWVLSFYSRFGVLSLVLRLITIDVLMCLLQPPVCRCVQKRHRRDSTLKKRETPFKKALNKAFDISPWLNFIYLTGSIWSMDISVQHMCILSSDRITKFVGQILGAFPVIIVHMIRVQRKKR